MNRMSDFSSSEIPNSSDTISRQAAVDVIDAVFPVDPMKSEYAQGIACGAALAKTYVEQLPSAQPEIKERTEEFAQNVPKEDLISRKAAIEAMSESLKRVFPEHRQIAEKCLNVLPSAQEKPFNLPEIYIAEGYDTIEGEDGNVGFGVYVPDETKIYVAGDVPNEVFVKALFHELLHWVQDATGNPFDEDEANAFADRIYYALQSSQPDKETAKRVLWSGWKGHRNTRYKCPTCKKPVKNDDVYCHRCGQKLMFPHIDHTPYVPGEKQELIVRWDDE